MSDAVVSVRELVKKHGELIAVRGISFEVARGEMFGLIGPDGAGKTTALRTILGLHAPDAGEVRTCGLVPHRQPLELSRRIGYLSQRFSLYGDLSVDENVAFFAEAHDTIGYERRRDELLELLRLGPFRKRLADRLSGGMKQKLALACTLIHEPELLVLDEPTTGVDPVSRRDFWRVLAKLQSAGLTILLTTPYLDEAERCRRVALMNAGELLVVDEPGKLRDSGSGKVVELVAKPLALARQKLSSSGHVRDAEVFGERLHVTLAPGTGDPESAVRRALEGTAIEILSCREVRPSLEDVFIARLRTA